MKKNKRQDKLELERYMKNDFVYRECFKETEDDWYPSFRLSTTYKLVCVCLRSNKFVERTSWIISVSGMDDTWMAVWFESREEAERVFDRVLSLKFANKIDLLELGLEYQ